MSNEAFYGGEKAVEKLVESIHRTPKVYMTGKRVKLNLLECLEENHRHILKLLEENDL